MKLRLFHLTRLFLLVVSLAAVLFIAGLHMCQDFKQEVLSALGEGDDMATMALLCNQQQKGKPNAFNYQVTATVCLKNGNTKTATACLLKSIELGK